MRTTSRMCAFPRDSDEPSRGSTVIAAGSLRRVGALIRMPIVVSPLRYASHRMFNLCCTSISLLRSLVPWAVRSRLAVGTTMPLFPHLVQHDACQSDGTTIAGLRALGDDPGGWRSALLIVQIWSARCSE